MTKVSVMMPVFNGEKYIAEAINSILAQTHKDWELIIIDDGSTDNTAEIIKTYRDRRIVYYWQENAGEGAARNTALEHITGEYIAFLDADDVLLPISLESNSLFLDRYPDVMVVYSDGFYCNQEGKPIKQFSSTRSENYDGKVLQELAVSPFTCAPCSVMIRKSAIDKIDLHFMPDLLIGTDWNFLLELARFYMYGYNPESTCKYRIHGGNVTLTYSKKRAENLGRVRMGILSLPEYTEFSVDHQVMFIYQLLFDTFVDDYEKQQEIMNSEQFDRLSNESKAKLMRLVGSNWLIKGGISKDTIIGLFDESLHLNPKDATSWFLDLLCNRFYKVLRFLLIMKRRHSKNAGESNLEYFLQQS